MRPPRLPQSAPDSLPISFSYSVQKTHRHVKLIIEAPEDLSATLLDGLRLFEHFVQQARRNLEAGYRDLRADETQAKLQADYTTIYSAYQTLRHSGVKHLAAVHALVADSSLPFHGRFSFSDFHWVIRAKRVSAPRLRAVPLAGAGPMAKPPALLKS
jgi:hypothetical protein